MDRLEAQRQHPQTNLVFQQGAIAKVPNLVMAVQDWERIFIQKDLRGGPPTREVQ